MIWVKNISGSTQTWVGQEIADGAYFHLNTLGLITQWSADLTFLQALMAATPLAKLAHDNSGSNDISDYVEALNILRKENIPTKTQSILGTDEKKTLRHGDFFTAAANTTTHCDLLVGPKYMNGIFIEFQNAAWSDWWKMELGDKDGIVVPQAVIDAAGGFYPVAEAQLPRCPVGTETKIDFESAIMSDPIPSGLYYRLSYTNTQASQAVDIIFILRGFKDR